MSIAPQIVAADPRLTVFVTANAGSGKTTTLVNRVARLLLDQVDPGAILCVTYTKAAAAEMQARLFDQLGGCVSMPNSGTAPGPCTERPRIGARRMSIDGRREPCGTALAPPARAGVANEIVRFGAPP